MAKNAILIVEYALQRRQQGMSIIEAAVNGAVARLRPILMTSFAFIAGLFPLFIASGAGAIGNRSIGISAIGGMFIGTMIDLIASIDFDGLTPKATSLSSAIPVTSWSNINKVQMFLYNNTSGKVAFSAIIDPSTVTGTSKTFQWANVPEGTYQLALVANINSATTGGDNVATSLDGGISPTVFDAYNVKDKNLNTQVFIDLKKRAAFPSGHTFPAGATAYEPSSEIFTAYTSGTVTITEGLVTDLTTTPLQLKREISLFRVRIDRVRLRYCRPSRLNRFANRFELFAFAVIYTVHIYNLFIGNV